MAFPKRVAVVDSCLRLIPYAGCTPRHNQRHVRPGPRGWSQMSEALGARHLTNASMTLPP